MEEATTASTKHTSKTYDVKSYTSDWIAFALGCFDGKI